MKAEERKADEKHLYREEKNWIYEINMLRCILRVVRRGLSKDAIYLTTSKVLVPLVMREKILSLVKIN
jgi:NADH-quinone oxidoreductase subunit I